MTSWMRDEEPAPAPAEIDLSGGFCSLSAESGYGLCICKSTKHLCAALRYRAERVLMVLGSPEYI